MMYELNEIMNGLVDELNKTFGSSKEEYQFNSDIYEFDTKYEVYVDMPGVAKENVVISYNDKYLEIKVTDSSNLEEENLILNERVKKEGKKKFYLESDVLVSDIKASLDLGVLKIVLPKQAPKHTNIVIE